MIDYHELKGYVSNSSLNILEDSPKKFKEFLDGEAKEEKKSYYDFGTAVHMYLLEPDRFKVDIAIIDYAIPKSPQQKKFCNIFVETRKKKTIKESYREAFIKNYSIPPSDKTEKWIEKAKTLYTDLKPYIKYLLTSPNKLVISTRDFKRIKDIATNIRAHKMASKLLSEPSSILTDIQYYSEYQILWEYKGIKLSLIHI